MKSDGAGLVSQFSEFLQAHRGESHVIVLQDYPDPDAISSALTHQIISSTFGIECDIVYSGRISHPQNVALVRLLGIELLRFDTSLDWKKYAGAVFVDNQGTTAEDIVRHMEGIGIAALVVVDHHELQQRLKPVFKDIRRTFGATATIYADYLEQGIIEMDKSRREHVMAATALTHGILTDTNGFSRASREDFLAAAFLSNFRDSELLQQIMSQARSKRTMEIICRSLQNRVTVESFSIAGVGYLRAEDRDVIPQTADFLVTEENIHTAIIYGIVTGTEKEVIIGSLRTDKITLDPDEFIKEAFGKDVTGSHYGGGKISAGGFQVPIGFLSGGESEKYREQKWQVFDEQVKHKLFAKIGVKKDESGKDQKE
ncbi:MAG: bifunctional oligoribonuclease/PAP phosphatase NrnA [Syntrophobacteraceae bacterium]